jgi:hypothetical protein
MELRFFFVAGFLRFILNFKAMAKNVDSFKKSFLGLLLGPPKKCKGAI